MYSLLISAVLTCARVRVGQISFDTIFLNYFKSCRYSLESFQVMSVRFFAAYQDLQPVLKTIFRIVNRNACHILPLHIHTRRCPHRPGKALLSSHSGVLETSLNLLTPRLAGAVDNPRHRCPCLLKAVTFETRMYWHDVSLRISKRSLHNFNRPSASRRLWALSTPARRMPGTGSRGRVDNNPAVKERINTALSRTSTSTASLA